MRRIVIWTGLSIVLTTLVLVSAHAAPTPPASPPPVAPPPEVAPPSSPIERDRQPEPLKVVPAPGQEEPPAEQQPTGPTFAIADIAVLGSTAYQPSEFDSLLAPLRNQTVSESALDHAVRTIQVRYRNDGYLLTTVRGRLVKNADNYKFEILVAEGYIGSVSVDGQNAPVDGRVYAFLQRLTEFKPLRSDQLERYLLLAQSVPGVTLVPVLQPTDEPGRVDLLAKVTLKQFDFLAQADNRGSRSAGPAQAVIGASANSFTSAGDRLDLLLFDTPFDSEEVFGQVAGQALIGTEGLLARGYFGYGRSAPGDTVRQSGYESRLLLTGASLRYPVIRTRLQSLYLQGAFDVSNAEVDVDPNGGRPSRQSTSYIRVLRIGAEYDLQDALFGAEHLAGNRVTLTLHKGIPEAFLGTSNNYKLQARPGEVNNFQKYTLDAEREQGLFGWKAADIKLYTAATGQWTPFILPPNERLYLGGYQFGRGLYNGQVSGDRAVAGTVELRYYDHHSFDFSSVTFSDSMTYFFYDTGQIWSRAVGDVRSHVESMGIGEKFLLAGDVEVRVEGVELFTRRPIGSDNVSLLKEQQVFLSVVSRF